jgi:hypothetical protein
MLTNHAMMLHHKYSLAELDEMIPWERFIYLELIAKWIKEEQERTKTHDQ